MHPERMAELGGTPSSPVGLASEGLGPIPHLAAMLPPRATGVVHDPSWPDEVLPGEASVVRSAATKRREEYAAGRTCARRALRQLGIEGWSLLPGSDREPLWPPGVVGSITHTTGYAACAVALGDPRTGFGIDAEGCGPLTEGVPEVVCTPSEQEWVRQQERSTGQRSWGRVIFSAKESIYKAWYPLTGTWLDYLDVDLQLHAETSSTGRFWARSLTHPDRPIDLVIRGRYAVGGGLILSVATLDKRSDHRGGER